MRIFRLAALAVVTTSAMWAATFAVNSTVDRPDSAPGDGVCFTGQTTPGGQPECTLRAAVEEANALAGADEISIPAGTYNLTATSTCFFTYHFSSTTIAHQLSRTLCVLGDTKLTGAGPLSTIIDGQSVERVFWISGGATVTMSGVTIQKGLQPFGVSSGGGAGINVQGTLTLTDSTVDGNNAPVGGGGGIFVDGSLTLLRSTISNNFAQQNGGQGGGIYFYDGTLAISDSTISGNQAKSGGGIEVEGGTADISASVLNNTADFGGGIRNLGGKIRIVNSTVANNMSGQLGGGISNEAHSPAAVWLNNVTVTQNNARYGAAGIYNNSTGTLSMQNTISSGNTAFQADSNYGLDCYAPAQPIVSGGYNLIQRSTNCALAGNLTGNILGQDAILGALSANGGFAKTFSLLAGSPALNAGSPLSSGTGGNACAALDQRGIIRPQGGRCDIGSFENSAGLSVSKITPVRAGNSGIAEAVVSGSGFQDGATVSLRRSGLPNIAGSVATVDPGGSSLSSSFDLTGASPGTWDVVVTNPDLTAATLPGGFTIQAPVAPQLWSYVVGRGVLRAGFSNRLTIVYGNRGNVDAYDVPLMLATPGNYGESVYFPITPPPAQAGQVATNWSVAPVAVFPYSATAFLHAPFLIPVIPAGFSGTLDFSLSIDPLMHGATGQLSAILGDPLLHPALDPNALQEIVVGAIAYAQGDGVTVPASATPAIQAYATNQYTLALKAGRDQLVNSLGTQTAIYSLGQFSIDLGRYAETQTPSAPALGKALRALDTPKDPCSGQVLLPGQSCTPNPNPIPPPDPSKPPPGGIRPGDCSGIPNHHLTSNGQACVPDNRKGCPLIQSPMYTDPNCVSFPVINSQDPNEKSGPTKGAGITAQPSANGLPYTISFENQATASAVAQQVVITDQLDSSKVDLSTFSLGPLTFGNTTLNPPAGQTSYTKVLDMRPRQNILVKIDAALNPSSGLVTWRFTTLDPSTQEATTDPLLGFLPPNSAPPAGEGRVLFTIQPKLPVVSGTQICNLASVVFDANPPILTDQFCNTTDDTPPVSYVQALPAQELGATFNVLWSGTDVGSAISDFQVFSSDNGGPFTLWVDQTNLTQASFTGTAGHSYAFYSIARDQAGNVEATKTVADTSTTIESAVVCSADVTSQYNVVRGGFRLDKASGKYVQTVTVTTKNSSPAPTGLRFVLDALTANVSLANQTGQTSCAAPLGSPYAPFSPAAGSAPTISAVLQFANPGNVAIRYTLRLLAPNAQP